jgi:alpha-beta hydrolase superfamily lysophospholipase
MNHTESDFTGARGCRIHRQSWVPDADPGADVFIAHGASEHSGRYGHVVSRLVEAGFAVHAVDHRGHGRSQGPRAYLERFDYVLEDLDQAIDAVRRPGRPFVLLGHSMGGCVAIAYALRHQDKLDALVLSAPLAVLAAAPLPLRVVARALSIAVPKLGVYEVDAQKISRDPAEVRAYDSDPLVYRGKLPARTVTELADTVATFPAGLPALTLPLLVMHGTADDIVPCRAAQLVHDRAGSPDKTLHLYEGYFHEIFNEPAGERERPIGDLVGWLSSRVQLERDAA